MPDEEEQEEEEVDKKIRRAELPPQILLKSMIRKGLTATSNSFLIRPRTA
jgi:hypothetical protein